MPGVSKETYLCPIAEMHGVSWLSFSILSAYYIKAETPSMCARRIKAYVRVLIGTSEY